MSEGGEEEGSSSSSFEDIIKFAAETQAGIEELRNEPDRVFELKFLFRKRAEWFTKTEEKVRYKLGVNGTQKLALIVLRDSAVRESEAFEYILELEKEVKRLKEKYERPS